MDEDAIHRAKMWILLSFQVYNNNRPTNNIIIKEEKGFFSREKAK
jgi:hypothetical protein